MSLDSYIRECTRRYLQYENDIKDCIMIQEFANNGYDCADKVIELLRNSDDPDNKKVIMKIIQTVDDRLMALDIRDIPSYNFETITVSKDQEYNIRYSWRLHTGSI